jgi:hypothetical protein
LYNERKQPTLFASTLPKPHKLTHEPKFCQRVCKFNPRKIGYKNFLSPLKKIKNATQNPTDNYTEIQQKNWLTRTDDRIAAASRGFEKWWCTACMTVKWLIKI